jgi:hypothetical protein
MCLPAACRQLNSCSQVDESDSCCTVSIATNTGTQLLCCSHTVWRSVVKFAAIFLIRVSRFNGNAQSILLVDMLHGQVTRVLAAHVGAPSAARVQLLSGTPVAVLLLREFRLLDQASPQCMSCVTCDGYDSCFGVATLQAAFGCLLYTAICCFVIATLNAAYITAAGIGCTCTSMIMLS